MSIQSTRTIHRQHAIDRIRQVAQWIVEHDYASITSSSSEDTGTDTLRALVAAGVDHLDIEHLDKWSNEMLSDQMDHPYYRSSIFDNYRVVNDGEEIDDIC